MSEYNEEQVELIRNSYAKGCTAAELSLFVATAKRLGLDIFSRQIYAVKRGASQPMTIQVSIDGHRLTAQRSGLYAGQTAPQWCGTDGEWRDVWLSKEPPAAARCGVLRHGYTGPVYAVARFDSYQQGSPIWKKMPDVMLHKCAESLALRKAFPAELAGIYTTEEMEQAELGPAQEVPQLEAPGKRTDVPNLVGLAIKRITECDDSEILRRTATKFAGFTGQDRETVLSAYKERMAELT